MKKLFKAIRNENLEEVKSIIEKNPKLVNCTSTPPPKKDNGQSPLQVALKIGAFEIVDYLIENGADVNFMEAEDDDTALRRPVLHDAVSLVMVSLCYRDFSASDKALNVVEVLLKRGADPNKLTSNGLDALSVAIWDAEYVLDDTLYIFSWRKAKKQLIKLFDLLIENGADFRGMVNRLHLPSDISSRSSMSIYPDDYAASEDAADVSTVHEKRHETLVKASVDIAARTKSVIKRYCKSRGHL